eukprot:gnl/TRDRNA2_/TRDRNA2_117739_c0_seq1.p1 gnl/TRDRNA2_/TRDRNA2_117739_c0~~gnl/TRDRNA2_/TRDRNA2_117739_c0_seq1.p1  ORF type:complete len:278 (+),score=65.33 gnl/TRDRNA2_/TRDRNA2_117739_c0_seq1:50-835(+)
MVVNADVQEGDEFGGDTAALDRFLASGPEPVYIGWGSLMCGTPETMCALALRALKIADVRGVVCGGWAGVTLDAVKGMPDEAELLKFVDKNVIFVATAAHEKLFPKCAAVVHHGGSGTTVAGFRSGRPSIITPVFYDQFDFAVKAETYKIGINAGHLPTVTPEVLAGHIKTCLTDEKLKKTAKEYGEIMKGKSGAETSKNIIIDFFENEVRTGKVAKKAEISFEKRRVRAKALQESGGVPSCWDWLPAWNRLLIGLVTCQY